MKPNNHSTHLHHSSPASHHHHHPSYHHWQHTTRSLPLLLLSISLTILFLISISYLIFNSIKQCLRRHRCRRNTPTSSTNPEPHDPPCMAQLRAIPVLIYGNSAGETETCAVCLMECVRGEEVRVLPGCKHLFHRACVDEWLLGRSSFCPVCRRRVIERAVEPRNACVIDGSREMESVTVTMDSAIVAHYRSLL